MAAKDAAHNPNNALTLNEELIELRKRVREQDKEIRRLKEESFILTEGHSILAKFIAKQ